LRARALRRARARLQAARARIGQRVDAARSTLTPRAPPSQPGFAGALPSRLFSGYLAGGAGKSAHYIYSDSLSAPATDPIIV